MVSGNPARRCEITMPAMPSICFYGSPCSNGLCGTRRISWGDLPRLLLERLKGGDFPERAYGYVIVDEFQDLTSGEQELMFRLRRPGGQLVALGDPRQSIYKFRGNDPQGLAKIEMLLGDGSTLQDVSITSVSGARKQLSSPPIS